MIGSSDQIGGPAGNLAASGPLRTVLLASAAAVLPLAALSIGPTPATAGTLSPFVPSAEPMLLTRVLRRPLPGGIEISTARSYRIRFVRDDGGFRIEGELVDVKIDAPKQFEALAALERARPDKGMFPMRIDADGRFVAAGSRKEQGFAQTAAQAAQAMVPAGLAANEARDASAFVSQVASNPVQSAWPEELFRPVPGKRSNTHAMPLPGGKSGEVSVEIEGYVDEKSGLMTTLHRTVVTRIGDSARATLETWTLTRND